MLCKLRYRLWSPIRFLLPVSAVCFALPVIIDELYSVLWLPMLYFTGAYGVFVNFPCIVEKLHATPVYFEDLAITEKGVHKDTLQLVYNIIMSFVLALIFAGVADYVVLQGIESKPLAEVTAIVYANLALFMRIQNGIGSALMNVCNRLKDTEVVADTLRRISKSQDTEIEIDMLNEPCSNNVNETNESASDSTLSV